MEHAFLKPLAAMGWLNVLMGQTRMSCCAVTAPNFRRLRQTPKSRLIVQTSEQNRPSLPQQPLHGGILAGDFRQQRRVHRHKMHSGPGDERQCRLRLLQHLQQHSMDSRSGPNFPNVKVKLNFNFRAWDLKVFFSDLQWSWCDWKDDQHDLRTEWLDRSLQSTADCRNRGLHRMRSLLRPPKDSSHLSKKLTCLPSGDWDKVALRCEPRCGRITQVRGWFAKVWDWNCSPFFVSSQRLMSWMVGRRRTLLKFLGPLRSTKRRSHMWWIDNIWKVGDFSCSLLLPWIAVEGGTWGCQTVHDRGWEVFPRHFS